MAAATFVEARQPSDILFGRQYRPHHNTHAPPDPREGILNASQT